MESRLVFRSLFLSSQIDPAEKQKCRGKKSISEQKWIDHPTLKKCVCRLKQLMYSFILINSQRTMY